jgi:hypothetical protein
MAAAASHDLAIRRYWQVVEVREFLMVLVGDAGFEPETSAC